MESKIMQKEIDFKNLNLSKKEKKLGWHIERCIGNTHKRGCGKNFRTLNFFTPSCCPYCRASRID